jgi:hypothetical protein
MPIDSAGIAPPLGDILPCSDDSFSEANEWIHWKLLVFLG